MFILRPHNSNLASLSAPRCSLSIDGEVLELLFEYEVSGELLTGEKYTDEYKNWGLWERDVFEVFLTRQSEGDLPYLELQVSPLNQKFALIIDKPRKDWRYPQVCPFESVTEISGGVWKSAFRIPINNIPGESKLIRGNLHGIIGEGRNHFSLNENKEAAPDFHRPDLFVELVKLTKSAEVK